MCEAVQKAISKANANSKASGNKKNKSLLISDNDSEGRPVGIGGRRRERDIMALIDGAQSGLSIPGN